MTEGNTASPGADPSYSHAHTRALSSDNTPARPFSPLDGRPPLPAAFQPHQMQPALRLRDHAASQPTAWQSIYITTDPPETAAKERAADPPAPELTLRMP